MDPAPRHELVIRAGRLWRVVANEILEDAALSTMDAVLMT